jgi:MFS transporter, DHA2 family, multidrug resistance protein
MSNRPGAVRRPGMETDLEPRKAGRREWIGLAALALPCVVYAMDLTVLNLALPTLSRELQPTSSELLWIVDIYGFLVAGLLVTMGTLGDRIGRRRVLMAGAATFAVASIVAAFATSAAMLIAARAALGIAGATLAPSTLSLIRTMFADPRERTVAIGIWATSFSLGGAIGPVLGGAMLQHFGWGSVFLLAVPVMVALLVVGPLVLPEHRDADARRLDLPSAGLSLVSVLALIYGLKSWARDGLAPTAVAAVAAGVVLAAMFIRRQRRLDDPLVDLRLFRIPAFRVSLATFLLTMSVTFGAYVFAGQYLQLVAGLSPLSAGLWLLPGACGVIAGSMAAPAIVRRVPASIVIGAGLGLAALGFFVMTQANAIGLPAIVIGSAVMSAGLGPVFTLGTDLIVGAAPPERAGAAAALSETSAELGGALGIAVLGSIGTAVYRNGMSAVSIAVPPETLDAARDSLGGATAAAAHLPPPIAAELLDAARASFSHTLVVVASICAIIAAATAIGAFVMLRRKSDAPATAPAAAAIPMT